MKKDTVDYILKKIPRDLWGRVKASAFNNGLTAKDWLMEAIEEKLEREEK